MDEKEPHNNDMIETFADKKQPFCGWISVIIGPFDTDMDKTQLTVCAAQYRSDN